MACAAIVLKQKYDVGARLCSEHVWDTPHRVWVAKIYGLFSPYRMFTCIYITFSSNVEPYYICNINKRTGYG